MGRPSKSSTETLRIQVWLKSFLPKLPKDFRTAYKLDCLFAQEDYDDEKAKEFVLSKNKSIRHRVFHGVLNNYAVPRNHLVPKRIGKHPNCIGSYELFDSMFWPLLNARPLDRQTNELIRDKLFSRFNLKRVTGLKAMTLGLKAYGADAKTAQIRLENSKFIEVDSELGYLLNMDGDEYLSKASESVLASSIGRMDTLRFNSLDLIALYGCLYREAFHNFREVDAKYYRGLFQLSLALYLKENKWLDASKVKLSKALLFYANNRILLGIKDIELQEEGKPKYLSKEAVQLFTGFTKELDLDNLHW